MSGEANAYLSELRAENERLRAVVARVEGLANDLDSYVAARGKPATGTYDDGLNRAQAATASDLRYWLKGSTGSDPTLTERYEGAQGAGDGV